LSTHIALASILTIIKSANPIETPKKNEMLAVSSYLKAGKE